MNPEVRVETYDQNRRNHHRPTTGQRHQSGRIERYLRRPVTMLQDR